MTFTTPDAEPAPVDAVTLSDSVEPEADAVTVKLTLEFPAGIVTEAGADSRVPVSEMLTVVSSPAGTSELAVRVTD